MSLTNLQPLGQNDTSLSSGYAVCNSKELPVWHCEQLSAGEPSSDVPVFRFVRQNWTTRQRALGVRLEIGRDGIRSANPEGTVLSMDVPSLDDGRSGAFCALNHIFPSAQMAEGWVRARENIVVLSLDEAWQVVKTGWIEPFERAVRLAEEGMN